MQQAPPIFLIRSYPMDAIPSGFSLTGIVCSRIPENFEINLNHLPRFLNTLSRLRAASLEKRVNPIRFFNETGRIRESRSFKRTLARRFSLSLDLTGVPWIT